MSAQIEELWSSVNRATIVVFLGLWSRLRAKLRARVLASWSVSLAASLLVASPPVLAQGPATGSNAAVVPGLPAALQQAFRAAGLPQQDVGLIVVPLAGGAPLLALNANEALNPASTMKLLTTYMGLSELGAGFRWKTRAYLRGVLQGDVLNGDLILQGGGDPKFVIEDLTEFIARMRQAGLREIRGNLVLDDAIFNLDDRSVEQFDGDPSQPYNVRPHGMLMNFKATKFMIQPHGRDAEILLDPPLADVVIDSDLRMTPGRCRYGANGLVIRDGGTEHKPMIRISGSYSNECGLQSVFAAVLSHRQFAHGFFKAAWLAAGGAWQGQTVLERGAVAKLRDNGSAAAAWLEWLSPRELGEVVSDINKFSNNVMARQLLLYTASVRQPVAPTVEQARQYLLNWLDGKGLSFPELVVDNGSGLSRRERISANSMAKVLLHAAGNGNAQLYRNSLPRVGLDGTMKSRMVNEAIAGNAWIKTGSLNDVRSLAGYVDASSGKRYAVVMLINGQRAELSSGAQDALLRWVFSNG